MRHLTNSHPVDSSTTTLWTGLFPKAGYLVCIFYYHYDVIYLFFFFEILAFNANSVDPDQMLHSAASDLGLQCLLITLFWLSDAPFYDSINTIYKFIKAFLGKKCLLFRNIEPLIYYQSLVMKQREVINFA